MESCMITTYCDEDYYEVLKERFLTSHRNYTCCECKDIILSGQKHEYFSGRDSDGNIDRYRTCLTCVHIRNKLMCDWIYTGLFQSIAEKIECAETVEESKKIEDCILMRCTLDEYLKLEKMNVLRCGEPINEHHLRDLTISKRN